LESKKLTRGLGSYVGNKETTNNSKRPNPKWRGKRAGGGEGEKKGPAPQKKKGQGKKKSKPTPGAIQTEEDTTKREGGAVQKIE